MQYVSLDIETTGLDPKKNQIVEVGAVLDEIGNTTPIEELPKFRAVLLHDEMVMGTYCANLHKNLWLETLDIISLHKEALKRYEAHQVKDTLYCRPHKLEEFFHNWLYRSLSLPSDTRGIKINIAGKNPGTFDIPFLEALPGWQGLVKFHRRVLDPASHCIQPDDEHIPDLQECLRRCGFEDTVKHTAVDDAIDIIRVIRQRRIGNSCFNDCSKCVYRDGCEVLSAECIGFESE